MRDTVTNERQATLIQPRMVDLERGRVLFVSDIHDRHEAFEHLVRDFRRRVEDGEELSLVVGGDSERRETFDRLWKLKQNHGDRVVLLAGNYECALIMGFLSVGRYTGDSDIEPVFANIADDLGERFAAYVRFCRSMSFVARTRNGIVLTHAGGSPKVKNVSDIGQFDWDTYVEQYAGGEFDRFLQTPLGDFLWNQELRKRSAKLFLKAMSDKKVEAVISVSGHAHISYLKSSWTRDGVGKIGKQILVSNFFNDRFPGVYYYLEIDTERHYRSVDDFLVGREIKHFIL